jgi:hypothetical protein
MDVVANIAEVIIGKQRHGPIGTVKLHFNPTYTAFTDLEERRTGIDFASKTRGTGLPDGRPEPPPVVQEEFPL